MSSAIKSQALAGLAQKRALLAERLRKITREPRQAPLSFAQQRLWFLDQLEPNSPLYNIGAVVRVEGVLEISLLRRALDALVARHETLRTRFSCPDDTPVQMIDPQADFSLTVVDLTHLPEPERLAETQRLIRSEINSPFNLSTDHPMRGTLIRLQPRDHRLVLILHHIVADEWSLKVLFRELAALYAGYIAGQPVKLPELPIQYADFADWQRQWLQGDALRLQLDYWKERLKGFPPATQLPTDHPRHALPTFNGRTVTRLLGPDLAPGLQPLAERHGATPFMVLLAAFQTLIHRYTQLEDLIVCSPVAGRNRVETEGLIGFFVNTLVLRTSLAGDPTFEQLLDRVREATLGAMAHQDLPFERLVEELQPERTLTHLPFTRLMFVYQSSFAEPIELPGAMLHFLDADPDLAKFDVTLVLRETPEGLVARLEYNRDLFEANTMDRLLDHLETLLKGIVAAPATPLSRLPMLTAPELNQVLVEWNRTDTDYPRDRCVHELFEIQAERTPEATAVVWGRQRMTYAELNSRANQVARFLKRFDIKPDVPVGLCVDRSLEIVVGILGILKAGGAYVPLDASYPKERLAFMLQDTRAPVVLTQQRLLGHLPRTSAELACLDADWELIAREPRENTASLAHARHLAYLMYTSGSTGQPKGVAVPHRAISRLVLNTNYIQLGASDRIAQVSNISFDAATFELWGALLNGAQLVGITKDVALSPKEFAKELREQRITAMFLTAALFNQLASEAPGAFETLRTVIAGGEALDPKWVRSVLAHRPPQRLVNGYGPTENTTFTCCHWIRQLEPNALSVPIGRPIANSTAYILDAHLNPLPVGVPGELYTGGDGLARGYWNRPELTREKFIPNPFDKTGATRLYRTGDLARYRPDGSIECLGRIDGQVKIRGFRVELGEIETQLALHPAVGQCVVLAVGAPGSTGKRLVAYVVPAGEPTPNASELRSFLLERLPDYMIPSAFVSLSALPLTPNGKVDRKALPAPDQTRPSLDRQYVPPRDDVERQLVAIWENVLNVQPVGIQDKFFDLGGHSMLATRVAAQIEKAFGRKLRLATIFQAPTIERLAGVLREEIKESAVAAATSLVEIQGAGSCPPLFLVHGAGGGMFWGYINLARCLGSNQPVYGFKARGLDGHPEFERIEEMAASYLVDLRAVQPRGPYFLGGYCFGGNVAYEMACQLADQGETVALLALLNCAPPHSRYTRIPWSPRWAFRFARNLLYWANYFGHWSANQRREFFRWKFHLLAKRFAHFQFGSHGDLSRVEPGDLVDLSSYTQEQKTVWETHIRALLRFHPRPYQGKVHLFRSPGHPLWCSFDDDYGWGELAQGGVDVITVSGAHEKILEEPWVKSMAGQLTAVLGQAQAMDPAASPGPASSVGSASATVETQSTHAEADPHSSSTPVTYPELFKTRVQPHQKTVAIRFQEHELSYAELDRRSNQLAHYLRDQGVVPDSLVAVALDRSIELGVALLAILKAGGAYLPLDVEYPPDRLRFMVEDARPIVLLTQAAFAQRLPTAALRTICLDDPRQQQALCLCSDQAPAPALSPEHLAYVIYTSGSTGLPKGVQIPHRALTNHNLAIAQAYALHPGDRVLQFTPLSFDISVEEIFPTWLAGATLVLRTDEAISSIEHFLKFISRESITVLNLPTAYWNELVEYLYATGTALPNELRLVVIGGEKPAEQAYRRWKQCAPAQVTLMNGYGATEATITTTVYQARPEEDALPMGQAIANTCTIVLDQQLRPVPAGTPGELFIGGAGLARGYLNRPELTARAFIPNPVPSLVSSERLYKTGDVVKARPDGNLEFVGRLDDQVKVRGFRIELGEVEAALLDHPDVKQAAVAVRVGPSGNSRLVAYFVPRTAPGPGLGDLLNWLRRKLPKYMLPAVAVALPQLPLTPAGKVDRNALPAPGNTRPKLDQPFVPPATSLEQQLCAIWSEVLEVAPVGVQDDFIELGGHSLLAIKVLSRIRETLRLDLSLSDFFAHPTIALLSPYLQVLGTPAAPSSERLADAVRLPLSPLQERIWFLDQLDPKRTAYNRAVGVQLSGKLNPEALRKSLCELTRRHEALRTVFPAEHGEPRQLLAESSEVPLPVTDLSSCAEPEREAQALQLVATEASRPYILSQPALRALLLRLSDSEHWLVLILNEIAADEKSLRLILSDLPAIYGAILRGQSAAAQPATGRYAEVVASVPNLSAQEQERLLEYWKKRLGDAPELLDLPSDHSRPAQGDYAGARCSLELDGALAEALENLAVGEKEDAFAVFLAAFAALLQRYTGAEDLVIGSVASLRTDLTRNVVGPFENRVALRCDLSGDPTFRELVGRCAATIKETLAHSAVPFKEIIRSLCPQVSPSYTPIFQVFLAAEHEPLPESSAGELNFVPFEIDTQTSRFDLSLKLVRTKHGYSGRFKFSTALFDKPRIARLAEHFQVLLRHALAEPDRPVSKLNLLPEHESRRLLVEWNATAKDFARDKTLADLFREQALRTPSAEALVCGSTRLTYAQLHRCAAAVAARLKQSGVTRESLVGICFERSPEMIAAILGTLLAGAAYVPLDPKYPSDRLAFTLQDANAAVLLTQSKLLGCLPQTSSAVVCLDSLESLANDPQPADLAPAAKPEDLAYVIYTSGSTGKPKGVALEHRNAAALVSWAKDAFRPEELSGVLVSTSICFDLSVYEIFAPLCCGGKAILADNALALKNLPAAAEVRLINTVPSAMRELLRLQAVPAGVLVVNLAGEPLSTELVNQIYKETSVRKVFDLYGPTETTTYSTGGLRQADRPATIGRPLANEQVFLLDKCLRPVPIGVPGELFIGGAGVARGYLHRPELTAEKFIAHPFQPGARLYRTGDLARWREDGNLEYLGRLDHQVKIRGFRIELGEIEAVLKAYPGVTSALVMAREDNPGDKRLAAYLVPAPGSLPPDIESLKDRLRQQLPDFMVPSDFVFLEALPLTPNGKVDRKALPVPKRMGAAREDLVAPRTAIERQLADIWSEVLGADPISVTDNFFDLGGHSLLAVRIISAIRDSFKLELPLSALFSSPTVAGLAEVLSAATQSVQAAVDPITAINRVGPLPVSFVQERLWFLDQLQPGSAAYNVPTALRLKGPLNIEALKGALDKLTQRHEALRSSFKYVDGQLSQAIAPDIRVELACVQVEPGSVEEREQRVQELVNRAAREPFHLETGPLVRATLFRLEEADHVLLLVLHHTISDGWSLALLLQELAAVYDALAAGTDLPLLDPLPVQYADFAHWQRSSMSGSALKAELAHWKTVLQDAPPEVALPLDHPRPERVSGRANSATIELDAACAAQLTEFRRRQGCTPFMVFLTALSLTLRRWTGQEDLVIGTVVAGRTRRELENVLGCFMNFLPLRLRVPDGARGLDLLQSARATVLEAQSHQDCPFEKIVEAVNPHRRADQNPLYNVALLLQNFPANLFSARHLNATLMPVSLEAALLDLRFEVVKTSHGFSLMCEYRTDLFNPGTVEAFLSSWSKALQTLVAAPESSLPDFQLSNSLVPSARPAAASAPAPIIAIASTFTAEPVGESLSYWLRHVEHPAAIEFAPYNQVFQQLLDPAGLLGRNQRGLNVLLVRLEDWDQNAASTGPLPSAALDNLQRSVEEFLAAIKAAMGRCSVPFLVSLCPPSVAFLARPGAGEALRRLQQQLQEGLEAIPGVYSLSAEQLAQWYPVPDYDDPAGDELGRVPYSSVFFTALGTALARKYHALNRPPFKVIALDCDNTLWSGVCGEDGPKGIQLDAARRELQQFMRAQRESGMLLCLCSKNNEADVHAVFAAVPEMPLRLPDFAAVRLNWNPKSANLKSLAAELGVGLDSFIFLDDNPVECAEVQANCPEVLALQLPEDPSRITGFLNHCWAFDHLKLTAEDRRRATLYDQNRQREKLRAEAPTLKDFLESLELRIQIEPIQTEDRPRVAQLTQRTNQFNFTTHRFTEQQLSHWLDSAEGLAVKVSDRFGDYGLVGAMLYRFEERTVAVDTFLLSCRVLGRGVEHRMLARLAELARARGSQWIDLHFVPSPKNKPALDFLEQVGSGYRQPLNGGSVYRLPVDLDTQAGLQPALEPAPADSKESVPQLNGSDRSESGRFAPSAPTGGGGRFIQCRQIALEANDARAIHQVITKGAIVRQTDQTNYLAPRTELERKLCELWQELLHVQRVGVRDDFFELGGHSLLAVRLFAEVQRIIGRRFPLVTLFQAPTIEQLARVLARDQEPGSLLVSIQPKGEKPPLFLVHGAGGDVLWGYANLAKHLPASRPLYGIKSREDPGRHVELEVMARSYLEVVRAHQPNGPYYLGGYCFGGNVAYEMARQLQMQGQPVALVVLIDTAPANAGYETVPWWNPAFAWRFARNLRYWMNDFVALEAKDRRRFFARKWRCLGRKLKRRFGWGNPGAGFDLEEVIDLRHFPDRELKLWQAHLEALVAHVERPYAGRVALIRTLGQTLFCSLEEDFCWGKLVKSGVTVRYVPGSHENIFMEPNVRTLASELTGLLEDTESQSAPIHDPQPVTAYDTI